MGNWGRLTLTDQVQNACDRRARVCKGLLNGVAGTTARKNPQKTIKQYTHAQPEQQVRVEHALVASKGHAPAVSDGRQPSQQQLP